MLYVSFLGAYYITFHLKMFIHIRELILLVGFQKLYYFNIIMFLYVKIQWPLSYIILLSLKVIKCFGMNNNVAIWYNKFLNFNRIFLIF